MRLFPALAKLRLTLARAGFPPRAEVDLGKDFTLEQYRGAERDLARFLPRRRYRVGTNVLLARLAAGAVTSVFLGRRPEGTLAVIKMPAARTVGEERVFDIESVNDEHAILARFGGRPGFVRVLGMETVSVRTSGRPVEVPCLAMEHLRASPLSVRGPRRGGLTDAERRHVMRRVLQALAVLHDHALLHRDVSPANVLLRRARAGQPAEAWLIDFGASRMPMRFTLCLGAPERHAPAVWGPTRPAADVFSAGLVFYLMWEGRLPFREADAAEAVGGRSGLSLVFKYCADPERRILTRMLQKPPDQRYADARRALEDFENSQACPNAVRTPPAGTQPAGDAVKETS